MRGIRWIVVLTSLFALLAGGQSRVSASGGAAPGGGTLAATACQPFPETGLTVCDPFLTYWQTHGGLRVNGLPLTAARTETLEDGKTYLVQWFERVRMEFHPENDPPNDVLLGQFGRLLHPADPPVAARTGHTYFAATGHNMAPDFFAFWQANGGLPQFGYPISEEFQEELEDGKTYTVQYTERARLEYHPDIAPPNNIQLGQFGRAILAGGGSNPSSSPVPSASPAPAPFPGAQSTIAPQQGPNWTLFVMTGVDFAPNAIYYLQVVSQDGKHRVTFPDPSTTSDGNGVINARFTIDDNAPPGIYTAYIASAPSGGQAYTSSDFILTGPTGPKAGPFVTVTPTRVKLGQRFLITGAGFSPNTTYTLRVQTEDRQYSVTFEDSRLPADGDGVILSSVTLNAPLAPGVYIAEVLTKGDSPQVVAGRKFTLTAASLPTAPVGITQAHALAPGFARARRRPVMPGC